MNLHSDYPFWMIRTGLITSFPILKRNLECDVLVIGGGITGALIADKLNNLGLTVVVTDKFHPAHGSTSASTAILQYEIDTPLFQLEKKVGLKIARRAYELGVSAIDKIGQIASETPYKSGFEYCKSLYYASEDADFEKIILPEFEARMKLGIDVELLGSKGIKDRFGFKSKGGILSAKAAHLNPYQLCQYLLKAVHSKDSQVYSHTEIINWRKFKDSLQAETKEGFKIECSNIVVACG